MRCLLGRRAVIWEDRERWLKIDRVLRVRAGFDGHDRVSDREYGKKLADL
jgi:hypothetical protein